VREGDSTVLGKKVAWGTQNPAQMTILPQDESCLQDEICTYGTPWQPSLWAALYANAADVAAMPPAGIHCDWFCVGTSTPPPGHEFKDQCQPVPIDECIRGLANCDHNAYCLEPVDGSGYLCKCDPDFFVSDFAGIACVASGLELVHNISGGVNTALLDKDRIREARTSLIEALFNRIFVDNTQSSVALVLEGVFDYPLDMVENSMVDTGSPLFEGRSLWRVILRIPT